MSAGAHERWITTSSALPQVLEAKIIEQAIDPAIDQARPRSRRTMRRAEDVKQAQEKACVTRA